MPGVRDGSRDLGETMRRRQGQGRVNRIVERVDGVVGGARVVRIPIEEAHGDRPRQHVQAERVVAERPYSRQQRQRVESRHLVVIRVALVEVAHPLHVPDPPLSEFTFAKQLLDRGQKPEFPFGRGLRRPLLASLAEPLQGGTRRFQIPFRQQWVVVRQRLPPVGEGEVGFQLLGGVELLARLLVAEAVQDRDAADEVLLRLAAGRSREVDRADVDRGVEVGRPGGLGGCLRIRGDDTPGGRQAKNRDREQRCNPARRARRTGDHAGGTGTAEVER